MKENAALKTSPDFSTLFDSLPGLNLVLSCDLYIEAANKAFLNKASLKAPQAVGKHLFDIPANNSFLFTSQAQKSINKALDALLASKQAGKLFAVELSFPTEKRPTYWDISLLPALDEYNNIAHLVLEAREAQIDSSPIHTPQATQPNVSWSREAGSDYITFSREYTILFGYEELAISTSQWEGLIHATDLERIKSGLQKAMEDKDRFWSAEYRYKNSDGKYIDVLDNFSLHFNASGELTYTMGIMQDLTSQKEYDRALQETNARFERIAKATNDVIWDWNLIDGSLWWNEGYNKLFGYNLEGLQPDASSWKDHIHPDDKEGVIESITDAIEQGDDVWEYTYRFRCADGSYKTIFDRGYLILNKYGKSTRMVGAMVDITEKVLIEQKLQEQIAHTHNILESLPLMIWTATPDGDTNFCNQRWIDYTGSSYEAMQGLGWQRFVHPDDWQVSMDTWQNSIATGEPLEIENRWRNSQDGTYRWFLGRAVPLRNEKGEIILWIGSNTDIHEQKKSQEQLVQSEKQFRFLTESIPQMVWSANPEGYIDYTNQRWYDYTKMDESSLGFGWAPAIHPDELDNLMSTWMHCVATGEKYEFQVRFQDTVTKTYRWFLLRAVPMHDEEGNIVKWFGTATDINDQKLLQEQLQASEHKFRFLAESIPQMVWTTRADGYHDYFNQRWMDYTALTLEESIGLVWNDLLHPDDRQRAWDRWQHSLRTGDYYEIEYRFKNGISGVYRWFLGQAMPMRDEEGNIVKWFGTCTDIEDHKRAEEELVEKNLELERTNQDLDSFVYTASHDLKLPVVNIASVFDELMRVATFNDPEAHLLVGMLHKSIEQLQTTIQELSDVVKVQKSKKRDLEAINLSRVLEDVTVNLQNMIEDADAEITTDFEEVPEVCFTRAGLKSILYNLLSNSIKYKAHNRSPRIHLSTKIKDNFVELSIQDNGMGIDMNRHRKKLFQMFRRFHNHVSGSGLGLYIVNRLLTNHGGYINIDSKLDEGTTFYVYFKISK